VLTFGLTVVVQTAAPLFASGLPPSTAAGLFLNSVRLLSASVLLIGV